jgi:hypothetical protein
MMHRAAFPDGMSVGMELMHAPAAPKCCPA